MYRDLAIALGTCMLTGSAILLGLTIYWDYQKEKQNKLNRIFFKQ